MIGMLPKNRMVPNTSSQPNTPKSAPLHARRMATTIKNNVIKIKSIFRKILYMNQLFSALKESNNFPFEIILL
jgi:hypothetical protein